MPQELRKFIKYCPGNESQTFENMDFDTFVENSNCMVGFGETAWDKMTVMTVGVFHDFINNMTLTCVLQVNIYVFQKTRIFIFSV